MTRADDPDETTLLVVLGKHGLVIAGDTAAEDAEKYRRSLDERPS
jgi:rhamnose utilization protein RhaD (predicted bifunctional aldolase and dehydrogenase)